MLQPSERVQNLGVYALARVFALRDEEIAKGVDVIDLGVGNPDKRPPEKVIQALKDALDDPVHQNHRYPNFGGMGEFKEAIARWYERRFSVKLDPASEVLPLIGSKEGIVKFFFSYLNPGDPVLLTTPCYPAYLGATKLNQAELVHVALKPENDYHPDLDAIDPAVADRAKFLTLNYPQNPTGGTETPELYERALAYADKHDLAIISDIAYCDISLDPSYRTQSFLEFDRDKRRSIEFHSFSKSYSMQGWRVGFAVGNADYIANLARIKANMDFSIFMALQRAAMVALEVGDEYTKKMSKLYTERRDALVPGLQKLGFEFAVPRAGMYLWLRIPRGYTDSFAFTEDLLKKTGVLVAPGSGFGETGEGFIRIALCDEVDRLKEAVDRLQSAGVTAEMAAT